MTIFKIITLNCGIFNYAFYVVLSKMYHLFIYYLLFIYLFMYYRHLTENTFKKLFERREPDVLKC